MTRRARFETEREKRSAPATVSIDAGPAAKTKLTQSVCFVPDFSAPEREAEPTYQCSGYSGSYQAKVERLCCKSNSIIAVLVPSSNQR